MGKDDAAADRLERLAEIEAEIDPGRRRRGRIIADVATLAIFGPLAVVLDFHVTRPFVLAALMAAALALNHLVPRITERRLRIERDRLLSEAVLPTNPTDRRRR